MSPYCAIDPQSQLITEGLYPVSHDSPFPQPRDPDNYRFYVLFLSVWLIFKDTTCKYYKRLCVSLFWLISLSAMPSKSRSSWTRVSQRMRGVGKRMDTEPAFVWLLVYCLYRHSLYAFFSSCYYVSYILWYFLTFQSINYVLMILCIKGTFTMVLLLVLSTWLLSIGCTYNHDLILMEQKRASLLTIEISLFSSIFH